jgi:hypothetical protein
MAASPLVPRRQTSKMTYVSTFLVAIDINILALVRLTKRCRYDIILNMHGFLTALRLIWQQCCLRNSRVPSRKQRKNSEKTAGSPAVPGVAEPLGP